MRGRRRTHARRQRRRHGRRGWAFELAFPLVWEKQLYKRKLVFIDVDDDGLCDPALDLVFADNRATEDLVLTVHGPPSGAATVDTFRRSADALVDCARLNAAWPTQ